MRTLFLTLLLIILKSLPVISQPKYEIRATWLTTLGGMDWPRTKAGSATGIQRYTRPFESCEFQYSIIANPPTWGYDISVLH